MPVHACIVIPVYNHATTLRHVVESALTVLPHVIVVDDGSTDGALEVVVDLPVQFIRLPENKGKGAALRRGAQEAMANGFTHMITMDADNQHLAIDLPAFLSAITKFPEDIIVGSRDFSVPDVPVSSRFGRSFSHFWMFIHTGKSISDMQSGFRAYPLNVLRMIKCRECHYSFEIEILVKAVWAGFDIREIPIHVYYPPAQKRISHFRAVVDNIRISLLNTKLTLRALTPLPFRLHALDVGQRLSLRHPIQTFRNLSKGANPHTLATSAAWSLLISSIPIIGFNTLALLFTINALKLNRLCALVLVPITWPPLIPGAAVLLGHRVLRGSWLTRFDIQTLGYEAGCRLLDWLAGSLILAPFLAIVGYGIVYGLSSFLVRKG